ncbi:transcriptional regulator with PAS, ATPase and Fis domain [Sporohalobacter salinus]|nr:hypothetical protein [Sporohalobacter salinus]MBM7623363.1 transcriptional regulator with PAS, ATPase and Fis domain [Sporohalobacter salinus]
MSGPCELVHPHTLGIVVAAVKAIENHFINQNKEITGVVSTFKELEAVQNLVNRMVGSQAKFTFGDIIGQSTELQEAKRLSRLASRNFSNILLLGESGIRKDLFFRLNNFR